jgi:hypothetical protein
MLSTTIFTVLLTVLHSITPAASVALPNNGLALNSRDAAKSVPFPFDPSNAAVLEDVFGAIEDIPDDLISQGGEAIRAWLEDKTGITQPPGESDLSARSDSLEARGLFQVLKW